MKLDKNLSALIKQIGRLNAKELDVVSQVVDEREEELLHEQMMQFKIGSRVTDGSVVGRVIGRNRKTLRVLPDDGDVGEDEVTISPRDVGELNEEGDEKTQEDAPSQSSGEDQ